MPPQNVESIVKELREDIKRARKDLAMLSGIFGLEGDVTSLAFLVNFLEKIYYRPDALTEFVRANYKA